jgi:DNA primase
VEGESDAIACIDQGMLAVIAATGGAANLAGHERHRDWLTALKPVDVAVFGDLDGPGAVERRAAWWLAQGVPARVVALPEVLGPGGDVRDYLLGRPS